MRLTTVLSQWLLFFAFDGDGVARLARLSARSSLVLLARGVLAT